MYVFTVLGSDNFTTVVWESPRSLCLFTVCTVIRLLKGRQVPRLHYKIPTTIATNSFVNMTAVLSDTYCFRKSNVLSMK